MLIRTVAIIWGAVTITAGVFFIIKPSTIWMFGRKDELGRYVEPSLLDMTITRVAGIVSLVFGFTLLLHLLPFL